MGGATIYHLGDTALFGDLELIGRRHAIDVALICRSVARSTMDRHDAVEAARMIGARQVIPCHYDTFPLIATDAHAFRAEVELDREPRGDRARAGRAARRMNGAAAPGEAGGLGPPHGAGLAARPICRDRPLAAGSAEVNVRQLLRSPPVKPQFGPTLPQMLAPRIESLPKIVARILAALVVIVVAALILVGVRLHDPVFSYAGPPASLRFRTSYPRAMHREPASPGVLLSLRESSSIGLAAAFEIRILHLPRYSGEISGLLPVIAINTIRRLEAGDPTFVLWSQGRTRINLVPGYTFTFQQTIDGRVFWGRYVFLTPQIKGDREGLLISMLTDPALLAGATPPITPDSVASVGLLFEPLERLRFSG